MKIILLVMCFLLCINLGEKVFAHEVNYQVREREGICVSFFFADKSPMNYAKIEVYAPDERIPFQKARTDKNGIFCFMPDKKGIWRVVVKGETEHGLHGAEVEMKIKDRLEVEGFKKPLIASHTRFFIAFGIVGWIIGITGVYLFLKSRKSV